MAKEMIQDGTITKGSSNVFADLGFPPEEADNLRRRSQIMIALRTFIEKRGLTQAEAATQLNFRPTADFRSDAWPWVERLLVKLEYRSQVVTAQQPCVN